MPTQSRAVLIIVPVVALAGLLVYFRSIPQPQNHPDVHAQPAQSAGSTTPTSEPSTEALPSKTKPRLPSPLVTKARTQALLETPIPGPVEFPEQTVLERIEAINFWLEKSGIPREELQIIVEAKSSEHFLATGMICQDFRARDFPPSLILLDMFGRSKLRHRVLAGVVEFHLLGVQEPSDLEPFERPDTDNPVIK